jgi:hypothetical protein
MIYLAELIVAACILGFVGLILAGIASNIAGKIADRLR